MTVLIVEDDELIRSALNRIASNYFDEVAEAENAYSALACINANPPNVLLSDWDLGGKLSGLDVASYANDNCPSCKVVLFTGKSLEQLRALTQHLDVHTYIAKPFSLEDIRCILEELVQLE